MATGKNNATEQGQQQTEGQEQEKQQEQAIVAASPVNITAVDYSDMGFTEEELAGLSGMDDLDASEIKVPYAEVQAKDPTNPTHKKGDIVFPDGTIIRGSDGEWLENVAILQVKKVRVMFPVPFNPKNGFTCRSIDGVRGHVDGAHPGRLCSDCEHSKYPKDGGASPCRDQRLLLMSKSDGSLFHQQIAGVGMPEWKTFLSSIMHLMKAAGNRMAAFRLDMGTKIVNTPNGPFAALVFRLHDTKAPFFPNQQIRGFLEALSTYKVFEREYLESDAVQSQATFADGMGTPSQASGQNDQMF